MGRKPGNTNIKSITSEQTTQQIIPKLAESKQKYQMAWEEDRLQLQKLAPPKPQLGSSRLDRSLGRITQSH